MSDRVDLLDYSYAAVWDMSFQVVVAMFDKVGNLFYNSSLTDTSTLSSDQEVKVPILDRVNLAIPKGSLAAVIGEAQVNLRSLATCIRFDSAVR
ncbi:Armadillo-like helical [Artemisia annua]|uniref:Armadillo-like helical n=1 Tax=Artemisia annua TaxID=35608 RepID=A0A2U1PJ06_ARTAN|nr:Armadillo-like helical [Artemisia annua]